jgi:hypothetical protein
MIKLQNWVLALLRKLEEGSNPAERNPGGLVFTSNLRRPDS